MFYYRFYPNEKTNRGQIMIFDIEEQEGRLDQVLSALIPEASRTKLKEAIKNGAIQMDGLTVTKPATMVNEAKSLTCQVVIEQAETELKPCVMDLNIVHEDDDLIVVIKPKGILVHPTQTGKEETLVAGVLAHCGELAKVDNPFRPGVVHRLDRHTEGLLVFAKTGPCFEGLKQQFQDRTVTKKYYAMLKGNLPDENYHLETLMGRHRVHRHKQTSFSPVPGTEKKAITILTVVERFNTKTFCDVSLLTGRTHQIRVHCSELGYPVLGDTVYDSNCGKNYDGQLLQAYALSFTHPITQDVLSFEIPSSKIFS